MAQRLPLIHASQGTRRPPTRDPKASRPSTQFPEAPACEVIAEVCQQTQPHMTFPTYPGFAGPPDTGVDGSGVDENGDPTPFKSDGGGGTVCNCDPGAQPEVDPCPDEPEQ